MQYHVYITTPLLQRPAPELSKYFEQSHDAELYYTQLTASEKFHHRPFILVLEKIDNKTILKRHDFAHTA